MSAPAPSASNPSGSRTLPDPTALKNPTHLPNKINFPPPRPPPAPPRPTQLPYHELKRNPDFRALSRKYTRLMVAIPIALGTSYVLYDRYKNPDAQRQAKAIMHKNDGQGLT